LRSRFAIALPSPVKESCSCTNSGDTPESQNRILAGTFHPDTEGKTDVVLTAAVDPRLYPILVITAEPGDGDPRPSDTEILRGELDVID
jgi:hypothetical protein